MFVSISFVLFGLLSRMMINPGNINLTELKMEDPIHKTSLFEMKSFRHSLTGNNNNLSVVTQLTANFLVPLACFLVISIILMSCSGTAGTDIRKSVKTESGLVSGIPGIDTSIMVFKGISFAAPPVGDLRWKAPQPPVPWKGVRMANGYCKPCIQNLTLSNLPWTEEYMPQTESDEDCLSLNIWTPAKNPDEKLPVLVYVPGGAFTGGSGDIVVYNGEGLAQKGVIVVTINYRVGVLGFLALPELTAESPDSSSGNYGLLDQVAALSWVKHNIQAFGGDPENVTVSGQSAGAQSVYFLTASPLAKGLFQRAIAESSPYSSRRKTLSLEIAEKTGQHLMDTLGVKSLQELRAIPAKELHKKANSFNLRFGPVVDGWFLPEDVTAIYSQGKQNDTPLLTGLNADEGSSGSTYGKMPLKDYKERIAREWGDMTGRFLKLYPVTTEAESEAAQKQSARDAGLANMYDWAHTRAMTGKTPEFNYFFERVTPWPEFPQYGAFHSSEIPYVFRNQHLLNRPWEETDSKLSDLMSSYWVNFIKTGNPNGTGLSEWSPATDSMMRFSESSKADAILPKEKLEFYLNAMKR